jgi:hypothetical protein
MFQGDVSSTFHIYMFYMLHWCVLYVSLVRYICFMLIYEQMMLRPMQCKCQNASLTPGVLHNPCLAYGLPRKDGGEEARSGIDRSDPKGQPPPADAAQPPLRGSVPPWHVEAVECMLHAKYSFEHRHLPCINRGVPPLSNTPHTPQHLEE